MSCRRAYEIDIAGYLADPRAAEFAAFRAHYPGCAACAAELRAWTELEALLRAGAPGHPEPALLLRYEDAREGLASEVRAGLEAHLARCPACRDELAGLRTLQPTLVSAAPPPAPRAAERPSIAAVLRRLFWQPAFAYALAFVLAAPLLYLQVTRERLDLRTEPKAATREAPPPAPARPPPAKEPERPQPPMAMRASPPDVARRQEGARDREIPREQLRALGYVTEGIRPDATPGSEPARLPLRPDGRGGHLVRVPLERGEGSVEVRIESPDGARSLSQRFPAGTASAELWLPPGWIEAGAYRVTVRSERGEREYVTER